jgi:hypothetical protein
MTPLLAHSEDHARKLISVLITECRQEVSDREREALRLADKFKIEGEPISARFAAARKLKVQELAERGGGIAAELDAAVTRTYVKRPTPILKPLILDNSGPAKAVVRRKLALDVSNAQSPVLKPQLE